MNEYKTLMHALKERKAMDELSAKWKERALQIELEEYEKLDQYFKDYNESLKK